MDENSIKNLLKEKFNLFLISINNFPEHRYIAECEDAFGAISKVAISVNEQDLSIEELENFLLFINTNKADKGLIITKFPLKENLEKFAREHFIAVLNESELEVEEKEEEISECFSTDIPPTADEKIERKARVLGVYEIREKDRKDKLYVDLTTAEIYKLDGNKISKEEYLKRVLQLPESARKILFDISVKKALSYEEIPKEELSILESNELIKVKTYGRGILQVIADELLSIIIILTDSFAEILKMKPTEISYASKIATKKYVILNRKLTKIKSSYNLDAYLQKSNNLPENFKPEKKNYDPEKVRDMLSKTFNAEVSFSHFIYLPYYERIIKKGDKEKSEQIFTIKFKKFFDKESKNFAIYNFIDKMPEVPFLLIALMYASYLYPKIDEIFHIFSSALIFIISSVIIGLILKYIFKTERKVPYINTPIVKYGFPSLHSLTSIGAITFVYFIPRAGPFLSLILLPLGVLYVYSRVKLRVHSIVDVLGGALIGFILGAVNGFYLLKENILGLTYEIKFVFAILFFILPIFSILYRSSIEYP
ncbi:MAG: phosphatase PAP2 family protein [Candidatus Altiarchaeota archaeon]